MEYKDYEILARVWESTSDLYSLTTDGELDTSQDILLFNDDKEVVWYEVAGLELIKTPFDDPKYGFYRTIEDAKKAIDWNINNNDKLEL